MPILSHTQALKRQHVTTKLNANMTKEIAVGSKLKYGAAIFVTTVKIGEKTTMAKEFLPK